MVIQEKALTLVKLLVMKPSHEQLRLTTYLLLFIFPVFNLAQSVHITETTPDLLKVPALSNNTKIPPENEPLKPKFDKRILVEMSDGNEMFLYINTTYGQVGFMTAPSGTLGNGELNSNDPNFNFIYFHPSGITYSFDNSSYKIDENLMQTINPTAGHEVMRKQAKTKSFFLQNFRAQSYKPKNADAPTFFLYGSYFPMELINVKMLGYKDIGYMLTNYAVYLVLEKNSATENFKVMKWENVNLELDFTNFSEQKQEERGY